jgi:5-(carboxyamino)imidazole ribonucleotide mutase
MDVLIIAGSESDKRIAEDAIKVLDEFSVNHAFEIASAHRTPEKLDKILKESKAKVIIAIAGLSAALPGYMAARVLVPVIGVPVSVKLDGLDALLSSMQMPSGIPVATVSIDGGKNAAYLAMEMLAISDKKLEEKLKAYREKMRK